MRFVTIKDIAQSLAISKSTVSRALAGDTRNVSPTTIERVLAKAQEMGYRRNMTAVKLRSNANKIIGIIVPEMITPFSMEFVNTVQEEVQPLGYRVLIAVSNEDPLRERQNLELFENERVDGLLVSATHNLANRDIFENLIKSNFPIVFFDRTIQNLNCSSVCSDNRRMSFFLVEHLIRNNRRRIVNLSGPAYIENSLARTLGYRQVLEKFHIPIDPTLIVNAGISVNDGAHTVQNLLDRGVEFDAIHCFTETQAIGAIHTLHEHNKAIPQDVAVCTMSGTSLSSFVYPQITVVEQNVQEMARAAVGLLFEKIKTPNAPHQNIIIPSSIIVRNSTTTEKTTEL